MIYGRYTVGTSIIPHVVAPYFWYSYSMSICTSADNGNCVLGLMYLGVVISSYWGCISGVWTLVLAETHGGSEFVVQPCPKRIVQLGLYTIPYSERNEVYGT